MEPIDEKREALAKAKKLLAQNDNDVLMYAALELRRCLEAVVYEKLWAYRTRIPANAAQRWQPPQAFRALAAVEPDVARSSEIRFAEEQTLGGSPTAPLVQLGVDLRPKQPWLNKTYNKLGNMLHANWPYAPQTHAENPAKLRDYLNALVTELEPFVQRSFTTTFATTIDFVCSVCGERIIANAAGIEKNNEVTCLNPKCEARYRAEKKGDKFAFELVDILSAKCPDCGDPIRIPAHKLQIGYDFDCKCGSSFRVSGQSWDFVKRENNDPISDN
jgi:hypothetical protein